MRGWQRCGRASRPRRSKSHDARDRPPVPDVRRSSRPFVRHGPGTADSLARHVPQAPHQGRCEGDARCDPGAEGEIGVNGGAIYNEIDPYAAEWLENLVAAGHIAHGRVDRRSIADLTPADVAGP